MNWFLSAVRALPQSPYPKQASRNWLANDVPFLLATTVFSFIPRQSMLILNLTVKA